jgi:hypothetical protein
MVQSNLCRKVLYSKKITTAVATMNEDFDIKTLLNAMAIEFGWWTLEKIYITTAAAYTGTFTFTVDVADETNEVDRAKTSGAIAAETDIEISDIGLDARVDDVLNIKSSAALTVGSAYLFMTLLVGT